MDRDNIVRLETAAPPRRCGCGGTWPCSPYPGGATPRIAQTAPVRGPSDLAVAVCVALTVAILAVIAGLWVAA